MVDESGIKTELKISLHAGSVLVAQSHDPILWQKVFSFITSQVSQIQHEESSLNKNEEFFGQSQSFSKENFSSDGMVNSEEPITKFALDMGLTKEEIQGACAPSKDAPYIHLDMKYWESFFKNTPPRGPASVSRIGLAATLLCLWFRYAKIEGNPTAAECQQVLETINVREANPTRSIDNSAWLQRRNKGIVINPARTSKAIEIAKTYCLGGKT